MSIRPGLAAALILSLAPHPASSQGVAVRTIQVYSCALGDSLLGVMRDGGAVTVFHDPDSTSFQIYEYGAKRLFPSLVRHGNQPAPWPTPDLMVAVQGKTGQRVLAERPRMPRMAAMIDDTLRLDFGEGVVGNYHGPRSSTLAPVGVVIGPAEAYRLAVASKLTIVIDSTEQPIPRQGLRAFRAFYRFAICDTLRYR